MIINLVYKLYLHHFDLFRACGPHHGQRDVVQFFYPVNNQVRKIHIASFLIMLQGWYGTYKKFEEKKKRKFLKQSNHTMLYTICQGI